MQRLSFLLIAFLAFFALESCKDVRLGADGVDAGGGGGGGAAGAGGTTSSVAGATATGGATSSAGGTTAFAAGTTATGGATSSTGGATSSTGGATSSTGGTTFTTLASGLNYPSSLVVDATSVYFINGGTAANNYVDGALMKVPTRGGKTTTVVSGQSPSGLAIAGTNLYWTNYGTFVSASTNYTLNTVMTVPISGGDPATLVSGQTGPEGIAVDATNVYWANSTVSGTVMKLPLGGGTPITLTSGLDFPGSIAVDATNVYWMNQGTSGRADGYARLMTVPIKGGTPTTLASADRMAASGGIAVDAKSVYWVYSMWIYAAAPGGGGVFSGPSTCTGTVVKVPIAGGAPTTLASGQFCPGGQIAVDATAVYWVTDGSVMAVPLAGGTPITLASGQNANGGLAIDATSVYWTVGTADGDGAVLKAPKIAFGGAGGSGGANGGSTGTGGVSGGSTGATGGATSSPDAGVGNSCENPLPLQCGDRLNHSTLVQGRANVWNDYGCSQRLMSGPETIYSIQVPAGCQVTMQLENLAADLDLFLLTSCSFESCTQAAATTINFTPQASPPYFVAVDGYNGAAGSYTLAVDCTCNQDAGAIDAPPADAQGDTGMAPGCDPAAASAALTALGITPVGAPQTDSETLPLPLTSNGVYTEWSLIASSCQQGGYDITPLAGKTICALGQDMTQLCQGLPAGVTVLMNSGSVACIYKHIRAEDTIAPGIWSATDPSCTDPTIAAGATVLCGGSSCTSATGPCCPTTNFMDVVPRCSALCQSPTITCDGPEDCSNGAVCCSVESTAAGFGSASCVSPPLCLTPNTRMICHQDADCPSPQHCAVPNPMPAYVSPYSYPEPVYWKVAYQVCAP
jgi:hypothetical protein